MNRSLLRKRWGFKNILGTWKSTGKGVKWGLGNGIGRKTGSGH
jgi:hypothetical protein